MIDVGVLRRDSKPFLEFCCLSSRYYGIPQPHLTLISLSTQQHQFSSLCLFPFTPLSSICTQKSEFSNMKIFLYHNIIHCSLFALKIKPKLFVVACKTMHKLVSAYLSGLISSYYPLFLCSRSIEIL